MIPVEHERILTVSQYKYSEEAKDIKMLVTGLTPAFAPLTVTKGRPESMEELRKGLGALFGVEVTLWPLER